MSSEIKKFSAILEELKDMPAELIGNTILAALDISSKSQRLNSPTSHTALYEGRFKLAAKVFLNPDVNLPLLDCFAKETRGIARQLDGETIILPINGTSTSYTLKINPVTFTGIGQFAGTRRPFIITPLIEGHDLKTLTKSDQNTEFAAERFCHDTTRRLRWDNPTSSIHLLPSNIRLVEDEQELVVTKICGHFSRLASRASQPE